MNTVDIQLTKEDYNVILDALENYKSKNMTGELMEMMLEGLAAPRKDAPEEEKAEWAERSRMRNLDRQFKEDERKKLVLQLDTIKAKILLGALKEGE